MNLRSRTAKATILIPSILLSLASGSLLYVTGFHEIRHEKVKIPFRGGELAATISLPRWGSGPFPAIVCVHSSGPRVADDISIVRRNLVPKGVVVLTYDKPGVGGSSGSFEEVRTDSSERQLRSLAEDVLVMREHLKQHTLVDSGRVGLFGGSQAGWIIPIASDIQKDIPFNIIISGPATSYGMEMYFSSLTGDAGTRPSLGLSSDEIEQRLNAFQGLAGYEPLSVLARSKTPTLWLFGERDLDIPAARSARILKDLQAQGVPYTIKVYPNGDHNLQDYSTGRQLNYWSDIVDWLRHQRVLPE